MPTLKLIYPVIRSHSLLVEVSDEQAEMLENASQEEKAKFIYDQNDRQNDPEHTDRKLIESAIDWEYAKIVIEDNGQYVSLGTQSK